MVDRNKNFLDYMRESIQEIGKGLLVVLTSLSGLTILLYYIDKLDGIIPVSSESILILILMLLISILIGICLYKSSSKLYNENLSLSKNRLNNPRIIEGRPPYTKNPKAKALMLLEPSNSFDYDIIVSIYYCLGSLEQLIGHGKVINIQNENRIIQVEIENVFGGHENAIERIKHNEAECLKNVHVKPFIHTRFYPY